MSEPKIGTVDVETAPLESYTWGLWEQNVSLDQIKTEWSILSFAWKWLGQDKVIYKDTGGRGAKHVRNDKALVGDIRNLLDEADIVIAQNGMRFDVKKINARLIVHGYKPYSPIRVIDTLLVAKKHFGFTSNKLEWMSKYLTDAPKSKHKKFPGFELWLECLLDNPAAWAEMKKYNIQDVRGTEKVYLKQRPWIATHPNMGTYSDKAVPACPKCGSEDVIKYGFAFTQQGKYQRLICSTCGGHSRGKQLLQPLATRKAKLA